MADVIDFEAPSQDDVQFDLRSLFLGAIRTTLEALPSVPTCVRQFAPGSLL